MSTMIAKLAHAQQCPDCQIIPREGFKELKTCQAFRDAEKNLKLRLADMSLTEIIREVLNGRAELIDLPEPAYQELYARYEPDMPYGVKKARDGDPYEWILNALEVDHPELIEEESAV